jgi:hypothetical protein
MTDSKREILKQVAAGDLTPEEAEARLAELDRGEPATATLEPAFTVRVVRIAGAAEVIGDATVKEAIAEGPHVVRREGAQLVIESKPSPGEGYSFGPVFLSTDAHRRLRIRMNPELALDAEIQAGSLRVQGLKGTIRADVSAGSAHIDGFVKPIQVKVQAGSVNASGRLAEGESHISCEAGSVRVALAPDSSVKIRARTTLGRVAIPGSVSRGVLGGEIQETVIGSGAGSLEIDSAMGSVNVWTEGGSR